MAVALSGAKDTTNKTDTGDFNNYIQMIFCSLHAVMYHYDYSH